MGIDSRCSRCDALMFTSPYDDDPMYCLVCGSQGDMPPTYNIHNSRARTSTIIHTARYKAQDGKEHRYWTEGIRDLTVRYILAYADRNNNMPALIVKCPWCGGETKSHTWQSNTASTERHMYVECPSNHSYLMVCDAIGDYYWR